MATDNIRIFLQRVAEDAALQEQIKAVGTQDAAQMEESVLKLAADQGLPFTAEELQSFAVVEAKAANERGNLSDSELEQVAGGGPGKWIVLSVLGNALGCGIGMAISYAIRDKCDLFYDW